MWTMDHVLNNTKYMDTDLDNSYDLVRITIWTTPVGGIDLHTIVLRYVHLVKLVWFPKDSSITCPKVFCNLAKKTELFQKNCFQYSC